MGWLWPVAPRPLFCPPFQLTEGWTGPADWALAEGRRSALGPVEGGVPLGQEWQAAESPQERTYPHPIYPTRGIFLGLLGQQEIELVVGDSLRFCYHRVIQANTRNASEFRSCPSPKGGSTVLKPSYWVTMTCRSTQAQGRSRQPTEGQDPTVSVGDQGVGQTSALPAQLCRGARAGGTDGDVTTRCSDTRLSAGNRAGVLDNCAERSLWELRVSVLWIHHMRYREPTILQQEMKAKWSLSKSRTMQSTQQAQKVYPWSREAHDAFFSLQGDALGENRETTLHGLPALGAHS